MKWYQDKKLGQQTAIWYGYAWKLKTVTKTQIVAATVSLLWVKGALTEMSIVIGGTAEHCCKIQNVEGA